MTFWSSGSGSGSVLSTVRKCINRLEILKLKYNSNFSSIFDSSFFEFEPKTRLETWNWIMKLEKFELFRVTNLNISSFKLEYFELLSLNRTFVIKLDSKKVENWMKYMTISIKSRKFEFFELFWIFLVKTRLNSKIIN